MKRLILSQYLSFVTIGFISSIVGPMLPAIRREIAISYSQTGLLLSGLCLGVVLATPIVGYLSDRYGKKQLLMLGGSLLVVGLLGCSCARSFLSLFLWNIIIGVGDSSFGVSINALCASMNVTNRGRAMSLLHFFYGLGAITGPLLTAAFLRYFHHWRMVYAATTILPVLVIMALRSLTIPMEDQANPNRQVIPWRDGYLWICAAFILVYSGIEVSIQGWLAAFWESLPVRIALSAPLTVSFFWIALTAGRLFSGRWADRLGLSRYIILASMGCIGLTMVWSIHGSAWGTLGAMLALGVLLAGIYPTLMASATSYYPGLTGMATAFISFFASLGGFFIPAAIGGIADWAGITKLPIILLGLTVMMALLALGKTWLEKGMISATSVE
jgi:fucose permease